MANERQPSLSAPPGVRHRSGIRTFYRSFTAIVPHPQPLPSPNIVGRGSLDSTKPLRALRTSWRSLRLTTAAVAETQIVLLTGKPVKKTNCFDGFNSLVPTTPLTSLRVSRRSFPLSIRQPCLSFRLVNAGLLLSFVLFAESPTYLHRPPIPPIEDYG